MSTDIEVSVVGLRVVARDVLAVELRHKSGQALPGARSIDTLLKKPSASISFLPRETIERLNGSPSAKPSSRRMTKSRVLVLPEMSMRST